MLLNLHKCVRRVPLPSVAVAIAGLCLLSPAAASAHRRTHLQSGVSEALATAPLQEPAANPPAATQPSATEPSPETSSEERAEPHARHHALTSLTGTECSISLQATPPAVSPGASVVLAGTVSCPEGVSAGEQTVRLFEKVAGTPGFAEVATATTEANGAFQFAPSSVEVNSTFFVRCDGAKSARARVTVAPQVTIQSPVAGTELFVGAAHTASDSAVAGSSSVVTFTGTASSADAGAIVQLEREWGKDEWHRIGAGRVSGEGEFSVTHTFTVSGVAHIRAVVYAHHLFGAVASTPVTYQIVRPAKADHTPSES